MYAAFNLHPHSALKYPWSSTMPLTVPERITINILTASYTTTLQTIRLFLHIWSKSGLTKLHRTDSGGLISAKRGFPSEQGEFADGWRPHMSGNCQKHGQRKKNDTHFSISGGARGSKISSSLCSTAGAVITAACTSQSAAAMITCRAHSCQQLISFSVYHSSISFQVCILPLSLPPFWLNRWGPSMQSTNCEGPSIQQMKRRS